MIVNPTAISNLLPGFSSLYQSGFSATPTFWNKLAMLVPSNHMVETYGWMDMVKPMREWIGSRVIESMSSSVYTLTNREFEKTVGVFRPHIETDSLGIYNPRFQMLGNVAAKWPDQLLKDKIQNGTTNTTFDGLSFFNTAHTLNPAGTQSNNFTTTALTAANFDVVRAAMMSYKGVDGESLGVNPTLLAVPPQLGKAARDIVAVSNLSGGATNSQQGLATVLELPELSNQATTWYLLDTSMPVKPFVFQQRIAPQFDYMDSPTSDSVFHRNEFLYGVRSSGEVGYGLWFLAARAIA
jgi:phage major head subunit gpT-like protein